MPGYSYLAVDKGGREKRGSIEAENQERAASLLRASGLLPVELEEKGSAHKKTDFSIGQKVKPRDLSVFCRQFVSILQAGVPMKEALQMLTEQTENKVLKEAVAEVLSSVEKGNSLADSMRGQSQVFPPMLIHMVEAGEASGNLEMSFYRMSIQFEKESKLRATVRKATIYPIILLLAVIGVTAIMLLYVIPMYIDMFADLDIRMPGFTMAVMNLSRWMGTHWYVLLAGAVLLVLGYRVYYSTDSGRRMIDRVKMRFPLFGKLTVKTVCAQFARTASTLLAAGIPTIDCLETVSNIVNNIHFKDAFLNAREEVMKGIPLSEPLEAAELFPPMVYHMTGIGEETGNVEDMLGKLADYYEEEVELTTQSVLAALEPIIILLMALVVGSLVIAIILPIAGLYEGLDGM